MEKKNKFSYVSLKETSILRLQTLVSIEFNFKRIILKVSEITEKVQNFVWELMERRLQSRANSLNIDSMKA
jgi:hypothetical protein